MLFTNQFLSYEKSGSILISIVLTLFLLQTPVIGQTRFNAGFVFGLNASQIYGDDIGGYNKLGLQGGVRGVAILDKKMELALELLYSQRGSYQKDTQFGFPVKISLQYVEVPFVFIYKDWYIEEEDYYKVQANAGFVYGRLLKAKAEGSKFDDITDDFNTSDISITLGAEYFTSKRFAFGIRWTRSLNRLYNNENDPGRNSLVGYFLSFRGLYFFGK